MLFTAEGCVTGEGAVLLMKVQCYREGCLLLPIVYLWLHKIALCGIIKVFLIQLNYCTGRCAIGECAVIFTAQIVVFLGRVLYITEGGAVLLKMVLCYWGRCCVIVYGAVCY